LCVLCLSGRICAPDPETARDIVITREVLDRAFRSRATMAIARCNKNYGVGEQIAGVAALHVVLRWEAVAREVRLHAMARGMGAAAEEIVGYL
jgi:hypothetical protein